MALRVKTVRTEHELQKFMDANGLGMSDVNMPGINASGQIFFLYDDGALSTIIDAGPELAGVGYGEESGVGTAGATIPIGSFATAVPSEVLGAAVQAFSGTISNTYVQPGSVVLTDTGASAGYSVIDNGQGILQRSDNKAPLGTINYATGDVVVNYQHPPPSGNIEAAYSYSTFPHASAVPDKANLWGLVIELLAGSATSITWELYEDSSSTYGPIASGSSTISTTAPVVENLAGFLSAFIDLDLTKSGSRWLKVIPNDEVTPNDLRVRMTWEAAGVR